MNTPQTFVDPFPWKLYEMLEKCETDDGALVISWLPNGKGFKVLNVPQFVTRILPIYFNNQSKYKSFQRQLNLWGFERILKPGPEKGGYAHKDFLRGRPECLQFLVRRKEKKKKKKKKKNPDLKLVLSGTEPSKPLVVDNVAPSPAKRRRTTREESITTDENETAPNKNTQQRHVTWTEEPPQVHELCNPSKRFSDYDPNDIWCTRDEYEDFATDRLRTIQCLRASGGNEKALDSSFYCIRGLEPFQTPDAYRELLIKRHFHQSTIILEQVRQSMLGMKDPERFRLMAATTSDIALRRAQEIAALDEHEVYNRVCRRHSLIMAPQRKSVSSNNDQMSLSSSDGIRRFQEWNARRLTEIYSQHGGNDIFRFNIRRDSLVGSTPSGMGGHGHTFPYSKGQLDTAGILLSFQTQP